MYKNAEVFAYFRYRLKKFLPYLLLFVYNLFPATQHSVFTKQVFPGFYCVKAFFF